VRHELHLPRSVLRGRAQAHVLTAGAHSAVLRRPARAAEGQSHVSGLRHPHVREQLRRDDLRRVRDRCVAHHTREPQLTPACSLEYGHLALTRRDARPRKGQLAALPELCPAEQRPGRLECRAADRARAEREGEHEHDHTHGHVRQAAGHVPDPCGVGTGARCLRARRRLQFTTLYFYMHLYGYIWASCHTLQRRQVALRWARAHWHRSEMQPGPWLRIRRRSYLFANYIRRFPDVA
jgi:hypothetical protein